VRAKRDIGSTELRALAAEFGARQLQDGFVVGRAVGARPDGWLESELAGWTLVHQPGLPLVSVRDRSGAEVGWLLGHPLRLHAGEVKDDLVVGADAGTAGFRRAFEDALYTHAGPFAAVLVHPAPRVYIDPYSALPLYYDANLGLAASSPFLLRSSEDVAESAVARSLDVVRTNLWHILGTSPVEGTARLLPNHALELEGWRPERIWPLEAPEPASLDEAIEDATDAIAGSIKAAVAARGANISITGGGDTRLLLASSRGIVDRLRFFTIELPDVLGEIDRLTARRLVARFELPHRFLSWLEPDPRQVREWLYRTGMTVGERRGRAAGPTYAQLDESLPYISGVGGVLGVGVGDFGATAATAESRPTGAELVRAFRFPLLDAFVEAADAWVTALPDGIDGANTHALFRFEMYYGCWGGPLAVGYPDAASYTVYPNGQRRVLAAALRLPLANRVRGDTGVEAIRRRWPELLEIPINRPTLRLRLRRQTNRSVDRARAGFRKLVRVAAS
jgi:hypothetical protein